MSAFAHRAHGGEPSVIPFFGSQALPSRGLAAQSAFMEEGFDALLRGVVRGSSFCFSPPFILIKQDVRLAVVRSVLCGKYSSTLRRVLECLPQSTIPRRARHTPVLPSAAPCAARPSDCWSTLLPPCRQVQTAAFLALAPRRGGHRLHHFHRPTIYTLRHKDTIA